MSEGLWVQASKPYTYAGEKVYLGQVFQLGGHRNDQSLLNVRLAIELEPQPTAKAIEKLPSCGECGRHYVDGILRDQCGMRHDDTPEEAMVARREKAHATYDDVMAET